MKNILLATVVFALISCSNETITTVSEPMEPVIEESNSNAPLDTVISPDTVIAMEPTPQLTKEEQIQFIRKEFSYITSGVSSGEFNVTQFKSESEGTFIDYQRAEENEEIRLLSLSQCSDHGCDKTSYYFSDNKIIFVFKENSRWVGNQDELTEERIYYANDTSFNCLSRNLNGTGGYNKVHEDLQQIDQTETVKAEQFNYASIQEMFLLNDSTGPNYFK